jgi:hypothetical protein
MNWCTTRLQRGIPLYFDLLGGSSPYAAEGHGATGPCSGVETDRSSARRIYERATTVVFRKGFYFELVLADLDRRVCASCYTEGISFDCELVGTIG